MKTKEKKKSPFSHLDQKQYIGTCLISVTENCDLNT